MDNVNVQAILLVFAILIAIAALAVGLVKLFSKDRSYTSAGLVVAALVLVGVGLYLLFSTKISAILVLLALALVGVIIFLFVLEFSKKGFSFNHIIEQLEREQQQGLVPTLTNVQFNNYMKRGCVVLKKEDVERDENLEEEKNVSGKDIVLKVNGDKIDDKMIESSKESFRWTRFGRYSRGRWRGYPYYRYWRFPYTRFIRYPYAVQGPARWVTYDGDYYYITF